MKAEATELHTILGIIGKELPGWTVLRPSSGEITLSSPRGVHFLLPEWQWTPETVRCDLERIAALGYHADRRRYEQRPAPAASPAPAEAVPATPVDHERNEAMPSEDVTTFVYPESPQRLPAELLMPPLGGDDDGQRYMLPHVVITPEIAQAFAERAAKKHNRNRRRANIRNFTALIQNGGIRTTHQGIAFNKSGELSDGQHRMLALAEVGETDPNAAIVVDITYNMEPEDAFALDGGAKRSNADHASVAGIKDPAVITRLTRMLYLYEKTKGQTPNWKDVQPLSPEELVEKCRKYGEELSASWNAVKPPAPKQGLKPVKGLNLSCAALWHYLATQAWPDAPVDDFIRGLAEMEWDYPNDPRKALFSWALHARERRTRQQHHLAMIIKTYNAFCQREPLLNLKWLPSWGIPEPYRPDQPSTRKKK